MNSCVVPGTIPDIEDKIISQIDHTNRLYTSHYGEHETQEIPVLNLEFENRNPDPDCKRG